MKAMERATRESVLTVCAVGAIMALTFGIMLTAFALHL